MSIHFRMHPLALALAAAALAAAGSALAAPAGRRAQAAPSHFDAGHRRAGGAGRTRWRNARVAT